MYKGCRCQPQTLAQVEPTSHGLNQAQPGDPEPSTQKHPVNQNHLYQPSSHRITHQINPLLQRCMRMGSLILSHLVSPINIRTKKAPRGDKIVCHKVVREANSKVKWQNWCCTYLLMQCAAVSSHSSDMSTPPHQWPKKPNWG